VDGSTLKVAAFARSSFPAASSSHTRTRLEPAGRATESSRAIPGAVTTLSTQATLQSS